MIKHRLFNIFVVAALTLMVALTIQGAIENTRVALAASASSFAPDTTLCDLPAVERSSVRRLYVKQMGAWMTYTDGGPTGVDGGLIHILSNERVCSK